MKAYDCTRSVTGECWRKGERSRGRRTKPTRGLITRVRRASCRRTVFDICICGETLQNYNTRLCDGRPPRPRHDRRGTIQTVSKCRAAESLISQKRAASEVSAPTATPSSTCTPLANLSSFALMLGCRWLRRRRCALEALLVSWKPERSNLACQTLQRQAGRWHGRQQAKKNFPCCRPSASTCRHMASQCG